uniref:TEA domain-containing protein n=1 Tax=Panagrellus redivivus TaxID=6233 RepID=A0A7E4ZYX3_PANRE
MDHLLSTQLNNSGGNENQNNTNSGEASPGSSHSNQDLSGDAEGVWSPDIDQAFHEALQIYPPCGRRKIILSDEGKMYGRNELIARYIKIRCGKTRTRKQVSSHIQVLARKRQRDTQTKMKGPIPGDKSIDIKPLVNQIDMQGNWQYNRPTATTTTTASDPFAGFNFGANGSNNDNILQQFRDAMANIPGMNNSQMPPSMAGRPTVNHQENSEGTVTISSNKLMLCGFDAYVQPPGEEKYNMLRIPKFLDSPLEDISYDVIRDKFPQSLEALMKEGTNDAFFLVKCWANVDFTFGDPTNLAYAVDSYFNGTENFEISVSTKVCSFGEQAVEKVEVYPPIEEVHDGTTRYHFRLENSPMCEYMVRFIAELKKLQEHTVMNSVLDNFTVLQIVSNKITRETLMVLAFILEVSPTEPTCRIYKITQ